MLTAPATATVRNLALLVLFAFGTGLFGCAGAGEVPERAELILRNGNVITMDEAVPRAEGIAIARDRILAVGSDAEVEALRGDATEIVDLRGATAVPGLIDAHIHFPRLGWRTRQLFLDNAGGPDEVADVVRRQAAEVAPGEWITGQGWHTVYWDGWPGEAYPDRALLDEAAPEHPVYLVGMASHAAWVNGRALEAADVTAATPDPVGGRILRDPATGEPAGILLETAMDLVADAMPAPTREDRKSDIELSVETALRLGLTSLHDAGSGHDDVALYEELLAEGELEVRLYVMYLVSGLAELDAYVEEPPRIGLGDHRLTVRALKAHADGALGARGAALLEPYADDPDHAGLMQWSAEELVELVRRATEAGYEVAIHAIGDRANRLVLDAMETPAARDLRPRIEHAQVLHPDDIPRFAELGIIASMQPIHATMDMGFAEARLGPDRVRGAYAWRSLLDSGARIAAGADTPAFPVEYTDPLRGIHAAVTRQDRHGQPPGGWYPEEAVDRMAALRMYTVDAAYSAFQEDLLGSLTPGKLADVTVLSRDILSIPADEIPTTEVVMTIVGGEVLYRARE